MAPFGAPNFVIKFDPRVWGGIHPPSPARAPGQEQDRGCTSSGVRFILVAMWTEAWFWFPQLHLARLSREMMSPALKLSYVAGVNVTFFLGSGIRSAMEETDN